jgi:SAM-dependent methyltransferase
MGWRHRDILIRWIASGALNEDLSGIRILNIGPWTGGESILLSSLGAEVDVVEEVSSYRRVVRYLSRMFDLKIEVIGTSIFRLPPTEEGPYDFVYASGVVTHLTDPIIGLRIMYNHLRVGGKCLIETQTSYRDDGQDEFWGPSRPGWVWFNMSRSSLLEMLTAVGFERVNIVDFDDNRRLQLVATKQRIRPMRHHMGASHPAFV